MSSTNLNINKIISEKKKNPLNQKFENTQNININEELSKNSEVNIYNDTQTLYSGNSSLELSRDYSRLSEEAYQIPKKNKKESLQYIENSPNGSKYSRSSNISYKEKYHIAYSGIDNDRGSEITWHEIDVSSIDDLKTEKLYKEIKRLKLISKETSLNTITDVWLREDQKVIVFITDLFGMGTLRQYLNKIDKQKLKVIKGWIITLLKSLDFLHKSKLIFYDLNCGRILFNVTLGILAIKDLFVASNVFYECFNEKPYEMFTPNYMSPELISQNKNLNEKSDIYSLGMMIIEIITLEIPYSECHNEKEVKNKILKGELPKAYYRIMNEEVKKFLLKLLAYDPNKRYNIENLLQDPFLKITKEDFKIIKVKTIMNKKKNRKSNNDENLNFKHFFVYKDFKEDPYNEEGKMMNDNNNYDYEQRVIYDENNNNYLKYEIASKKNYNGITNNNNSSNNIELSNNNNYNNINNNNKNINNDSSSELKEYENLVPKDDDSDKILFSENNDEEFKIVDENYNVHLKFLISEEGKVSEIQFTYNLLKDTIDSLMEEIKHEFNLNEDNLNRIYETLKKVNIYSKLCQDLELLQNNSF